MTGEQPSILKTGRNCWRIEEMKRASFLIDAADYFEALAAAIEQAENSIYIAGWDIDSRVRLLTSKDGLERHLKLGELINSKTLETPGLEAHLLIWDFAMIYAAEREWLPFFASNWKAAKRIHFHFDDEHPIGASQHQKFVVIDNALAFCGGVDLTGNRWDTPEHKIHDPRRKNPGGDFYGAFHDAQMMVEGEAAAALGELFRQRWFDATGKALRFDKANGSASLWPEDIGSDLEGAEVAIARTLPDYKGREQVREVEALYVDAIASSQEFIYIENQYLTSTAVAQAIRESLNRDEGPEITLVLPLESDGWLAKSTMDAIRSRVIKDLREADRHQRLQILYPVLDDQNTPLFVHAKVMIVDDRLATIGSANLSNRSMGFDSECNLVVEAVGAPHLSKALSDFRNRLLGEHLGATTEEVAVAMARNASIIKTIAELGGPGRNLRQLDADHAVPLDGMELVQDPLLLDPEKPSKIDCLLDRFVHEQDETSRTRQLLKIGFVALVMMGMAAAWRWTPLADIINIKRFAASVSDLQGSSLLPLLTIGSYIVGGFIMLPVSLLIGVTAILFPTIWGVFYAMAGCLLSAVLSYFAGLKLGKDVVRKLAGSKLNRLSRKLAQDGWLAVLLLRNLPIAPFTVINMIAGASHIRFKDFVLGTVLGMAPGIIVIIIFADRLLTAFAEPDWFNAVLAVGAAAVAAASIWWIRKRLSREEKQK